MRSFFGFILSQPPFKNSSNFSWKELNLLLQRDLYGYCLWCSILQINVRRIFFIYALNRVVCCLHPNLFLFNELFPKNTRIVDDVCLFVCLYYGWTVLLHNLILFAISRAVKMKGLIIDLTINYYIQN